ncbi:hypothetical protein FEM48_Zijuj11G0125900 [Ziziphus jujuba var. spinosa]|uniref:WRKY domain-containing protein n=1 Tax=Ziziphus jujuba var. spinosa TaxID=714518 RepID=A0A978UIZ1_ZIZJJ|nr:hypothetical protein FEM48_Zijuj11G0125900 [Ziziphus jujuba var. spinosa]
MEISTSWPENLANSNIQKRLNDELIEGRDLSNRLLSVLASSDGSRSAEDLSGKIVKSFSNALSILNVKECDKSDSLVYQIQADHLPCLDAWKSQSHSREDLRSTTPPTKKLDRRGCFDRRKTSTLPSWKRDTSTLISDGQAWRCTYKHDQGCKATKQVERIQVNPPLYRTTYFGHHTCRNLHQHPELMLDSTTNPSDTSIIISFDRTNLKNKQDRFPSLSSFSSTRQEFKEEITKCEALEHNQSLLSDYFVSSDLPAAAGFPTPRSMPAMLKSNQDSDNGDVINGVMDYEDYYFDIFKF